MVRSFLALALGLMSTCALAADYHVSPTGGAGGDGSAGKPFGTIAAAAKVLRPGDSCILHAGTYRETIRPGASGTAEAPITFSSAAGEKVVISGTEPVAGTWKMEGGVGTVAVAGPVEQVFVSGQMMPEARWPNCEPKQIMDYPRAKAGAGTGYEVLADPELPKGDMTGGVVLILNGDRWWTSTRRIAGYSGGKELRFDKTYKPAKADPYHTHDPYQPRAGNPYIIYGALDLLDAPGEWYHDAKANVLHYMPVGKVAEGVEVRRRALGVDLSGLSNIRVRGIQFFAATASLKDAKSCVIEECDFRYMEHFRELASAFTNGQVVTGKDNEFRKCSFGYAAGAALCIQGENNRVIDCCIFDTDYTGSLDGAIRAGDSLGTVISHCTILRTGRDGIQHGNSRRITISYNDISNVDLRASDSGGIYCWGTDGTGSTIAYNHVHDNTGDMNVGIYIDNFCKGFTVHHNLSWNNTGAGITLNSDAENHLVVNNTLVNNEKNFATFAYTGRTLTQKGTRIVNNLVTGTMHVKDPWSFAQGELAPVLQNNIPAAVGEGGVLPADSAAVDAGVEVKGITDGFAGKAPDVGAYESGVAPWKVGASWAPADMPKGERTSIAWKPMPPVTEQTMIRDGLVAWLDAASAGSVKTDAKGNVTRWVDRTGNGHDGVCDASAAGLLLKAGRLNGKPVVAGNGGILRLQVPPAKESAYTVILVARAEQAGKQWQRLMVGWTGEGNDWIVPSWQLAIPNAEKPQPFGAQMFVQRSKTPRTLKNVTVFGTAMAPVHRFEGEIGEVMFYDRAISDNEEEAIRAYLTKKWGLKSE